MPTTPNKGYQVPITGTETNTWGDLINNGTFTVMDRNLGGVLPKTLSNVPVILTAQESQNGILRLIGTLTGNVTVTTACVGSTIVENLTTGAFTVEFGNGVSTVPIPQGTRALVLTDGTNGGRIAADNQVEFGAGTGLAFLQNAAPAGWVAQANANRGIRLVNSSGGTLGGTSAWGTVFTSRTVVGSVGGTAISTAQMPFHAHGLTLGDNNNDGIGIPAASAGANGVFGATAGEGGGQTHTHSLSINNMDFDLQYVTAIHCIKS